MPRPKGWKPKPKEVSQPNESPVQEVTEDKPKLPFRKLWEIQKKLGAVIKDNFNREEMESEFERMGYVQDGPKCEDIDDYWTFPYRLAGKEPIQALDKAGDFSATVYPDGRAEIVKHTPPNRLSRVPGIRYADEVIKIDNLESFTASLYMLLNETDVIFDDSVEAYNKEQSEWLEKAQSMESDNLPSIHGGDPRIEQMWVLAEEFSLVGVHAPSLSDLPFKLANCLGISTVEKDWPTLADEVLQKADLVDLGTGPAYHRDKREPVV